MEVVPGSTGAGAVACPPQPIATIMERVVQRMLIALALGMPMSANGESEFTLCGSALKASTEAALISSAAYRIHDKVGG